MTPPEFRQQALQANCKIYYIKFVLKRMRLQPSCDRGRADKLMFIKRARIRHTCKHG